MRAAPAKNRKFDTARGMSTATAGGPGIAVDEVNAVPRQPAAAPPVRSRGPEALLGAGADDLSNHAWGLAVDMNSETNPPDRTYVGIDGATACATPMITDCPLWQPLHNPTGDQS